MASTTNEGRPRHWAWTLPLLAALGVVLLHLPLCDFPFWYHWDEETKTEQILTGERNLRHPLLLLHGAQWAHRLAGRPEGRQTTTEIGRYTVVAFAAGTVAVYTHLAVLVGGPAAGVASAIIIGLHPEMVHYGHYFKEDPALLFGWALTLWALSVYRGRPGGRRALLVGAALALCASGKHAGWLMAPVALTALGMVTTPGVRGRALAAAVTACAVVWLALNHELIIGWQTVDTELRREVQHLLFERNVVPPALVKFVRRLGWAIYPAFGLYVWRWWRTGRPSWIEAVGVAMGGLYVAVVAIAVTRMAPHYLLPGWVTVGWLAGISVGWALSGGAQAASPRGRLLLRALAVLALLLAVGKGVRSWQRAAGPDHRLLLAQYLDSELPHAAVAYDLAVNPPTAHIPERDIDGWVPRTWLLPIYRLDYLPGPDPLDALIAQGFTHVAISAGYAQRYTAYVGQTTGASMVCFSDEALRPAFYEGLRTRGTRVWHIQGVRGRLLRPELELYQLPPLPVDGSAPAPATTPEL